MKLKTLLLSSLSILAASSVMAADLVDFDPDVPAPSEVPTLAAPADAGVSVCQAMGTGFFFIPGTETCLRIGGAVEISYGYASLFDGNAYEDGYGNVEARMDLETATDSEFGVIGSHIRISAIGNYLQGEGTSTDGKIGLEQAYVTFGPAYAGFKDTLFNKDIAYGDVFSLDSYGKRLGFGTNAYTIGALVDNIGGGFYAGAAIESYERSRWIDSIDNAGNPDIVARLGIAGQSWGGSDLSVAYSDEADAWMVKSTTDVDVLDATQARLTAAYTDALNDDTWLLSAGLKHGFTDQISGFTSVGYVVNKDLDDPWLANAGLAYTPVEGFDVIGEVGYGDIAGSDSYVGQLKFVKSW